jgi:hypothetical protein
MCHVCPPVYAMGGIHPTALAFLLLNKFLLLLSPLDIRIPRSNRGSSGLGKGGIVAEKRNAVVLELQTVSLESESESIVGGSEMVYSHRRR